ncbi:hypothetical protein ACFSTC_41440 [Nonomuraea ferruginea]
MSRLTGSRSSVSAGAGSVPVSAGVGSVPVSAEVPSVAGVSSAALVRLSAAGLSEAPPRWPGGNTHTTTAATDTAATPATTDVVT